MDNASIAIILAAAITTVGAIIIAIINNKKEKSKSGSNEPPDVTTKREDKKMKIGLEVDSPNDLILKITVPDGFNTRGTNKFLRFSNWLNQPIRPGSSPGSFEYPIKGQVMPNVQGLVIDVSICTNQWWPQGKCFVKSDGTFSGTVFLDKRLASAIFRFDILNDEGKLLKRFEAHVE